MKKLLTNIDLQEETEFLIVPAKGGEQEPFKEIIADLEKCCRAIQKIRLGMDDSDFATGHYARSASGKESPEHTASAAMIDQHQSKLYDIISRIKLMYINKVTQI